jgi:hypothetical protein
MTDPSVHDLLLALAGRVDDDLLAWSRELLAVGEPDQAVELATAGLAVDRVVLPPTLRAALVAAAHTARTDLDIEGALAPGAPVEGTPHQFAADAADGSAVVAALAAVPARRLSGCTLRLTWRLTPAGSAPGPLPRAVVLVEADPDRSADVLAYLLATELERAEAPASVEVFVAGARLPAYHTAALREAREIAGEPAAPVATAEPALDGPRHGASPLLDGGDGDDGREPAPEGDTARRRRRAEPAEPVPAEPVGDPLSDPLSRPLLAPLLDPTSDGGEAASDPAGSEAVADPPEEWQDDWRSGKWAMPAARRPEPPVEPPAPHDVVKADRVPDEAVGQEHRAGSAERGGPGPDAGALPIRTAGGEVSLFDSPARPRRSPAASPRPDGPLFEPAPDVPLFGETPAPGRPEGPRPVGRRHGQPGEATPDGAAAESPAPRRRPERDLLAQLQTEFAARERRPRPYRRAAGNNGSAVNGHAPGDGPNGDGAPPDLAS